MPKVETSSRDRSCIEHILKYCNQLSETLEALHFDREQFLSSHIHQNAVAMCILQIGELSKRLSNELTSRHKEIPWKFIAGVRDKYAHYYGSIDFELVWSTAVDDIPVLASFCAAYLSMAD